MAAGIRPASPACGSGSRHRIGADAGWNSTGVIAGQTAFRRRLRPRRQTRSSNLPLKVIEEIGASGIVSAKNGREITAPRGGIWQVGQAGSLLKRLQPV